MMDIVQAIIDSIAVCRIVTALLTTKTIAAENAIIITIHLRTRMEDIIISYTIRITRIVAFCSRRIVSPNQLSFVKKKEFFSNQVDSRDICYVCDNIFLVKIYTRKKSLKFLETYLFIF